MNHLKSLFVLIFISSCASVPDIFVCRARSVNTGFCTKTISNEEMIVDDTHPLNGKTWLDLKIESVYVPVDSWASIKSYIIKQCRKHRDCNRDIESWAGKLDSVTPN